jgi:hypothetical protein
LRADSDQQKSRWQRFWTGAAAKRIVGYAIIGTSLLALIQLELDHYYLHQEMIKLQATNQAIVSEFESVRLKLGELALRLAQLQFEVADPPGSDFINIEAALQIAVRAVEMHPGAQPFKLEDAVYLADTRKMNPTFPVGPAWQLTLQVQEGHFIVTVSAVNGKIIFINKMN